MKKFIFVLCGIVFLLPMLGELSQILHINSDSLVYSKKPSKRVISIANEHDSVINTNNKINVCDEPYNVKADGTDQVSKINRAITDAGKNGGGIIVIPGDMGTIAIDAEIGIQIKDHITLEVGPRTIIKALPNNSPKYHVVFCNNASNWAIIGGTYAGERYEHTGKTGEWGHIIQLAGCRDYVIRDVTVEDAWGDGIYIGRGNNLVFCENGLIENLTAINNRRQGFSLISAKGLSVINARLLNTNGTNPEAGLDIEPNKPDEVLENIRIINPYTSNNRGSGITINFTSFIDAEKKVDIQIESHTDEGSNVGFCIYGNGSGKVDGTILNNNPTLKNNKYNGILIRNYNIGLSRVEIYNPKIINANRSNHRSLKYNSAISIFAESKDNGKEPLGNVHIFRPYIDHTPDVNYKVGCPIFIKDERQDKTSRATNISVIDPVKLDGANNVNRLCAFTDGSFQVSDKFGILVWAMTANGTLENANFCTLIHNGLAKKEVEVTLSKDLSAGTPDITFQVSNERFGLIIKPDPDSIIGSMTVKTGQSVQSHDKGALLVLRRVSSVKWSVVKKIGKWENLKSKTKWHIDLP